MTRTGAARRSGVRTERHESALPPSRTCGGSKARAVVHGSSMSRRSALLSMVAGPRQGFRVSPVRIGLLDNSLKIGALRSGVTGLILPL